MKNMFTILLFGSVLSVFPQEQKVYFDQAIYEHLRNYNKQSDLAIENDNEAYVDVLFNSFKETHLKGTLIPNLKLKKISGGYLKTDEIKIPILLISKKTCFVTHREEIKAINEMANQYKGKLEFVVIYWDRERLVKKATKGFNKIVNVVSVNERDNRLDSALSSIKNSFGVPASFYITENKLLNNIERKFYLKNLKRSTKKEFYDNTYKQITKLLIESETMKMETILTTNDN